MLDETCRGTRTILPATTTIERLCADALVDAERRIEARIAERVPPGLRRDLEHLLEETADAGVTRFVWLRQFEPGSNSADANRLLDRLDHLQRLDVPEGLFHGIPPHRITRLAPAGGALLRRRAPRASGQTAASRSSRSAPSSGRCSSPTRWWRPATSSICSKRRADADVTRFVWLRQFEPGSNSADANRLLDRLEHLPDHRDG